MHLAVLITNTDFSAFARARPHDGEKFAALVAEARPDWRCSWFWASKGELPEDIGAFDGLILTGSPASVNDDADWIAALRPVVQQALDRRIPLFGACFGHQLIAQVLGGRIVRNPKGWGHGLLDLETRDRTLWMRDAPDRLRLYGSHVEQVAELPPGARLVFAGPGCPVAGYAMGAHLFTVQHHPEMTHGFITDLVEEYAGYVGPEVTAAARASLAARADRAVFAGLMARFFETARGAA